MKKILCILFIALLFGMFSVPEVKAESIVLDSSYEVRKLDNNTIPSIQTTEGDDCKSILTPMMSEVVYNILKFIQYLGPVLVALLTIVDFINAALSGEQDKIKSASSKFMKRVVAAILLFFTPLLVNLIFSITGVISPSNCF